MRFNCERGIIITLALIFGFIFLIMLGGLLTVILLQQKQSLQRVAWNEALHLAEAGADYARWHIFHSPANFDFSGTYDYKNPQGEVSGNYQLEITAPTGCDSGITIKSTGWTSEFPGVKRVVQMKYTKPALVKYAFLTNNNVWFGPDEELKGPFHSNGGIRMDGEQNSLATSSQETYICGAEHDCSPPQEKPGIWGAGAGDGEGLWQFPVSNVDFNAITQDLAEIKSDAQNFGIYISNPVDYGFHVQFKADGTIDVFRVKKVKQKVYGWDGEKWVYESNDIDSEDFYASYPLPSNCAPIFIENKVWVDGIVKGRATLVAAELPEMPNKMKNIIINGNIDYADPSSVLGLIAQKDILIPLYSPDNLEVKAALLAKNGHVFRYYYPNWSYEPYKTYAIRDYIATYGSIITNTIWTFTWVDSGMNVVSGYKNTSMSYNPNLTYNPPPYFPVSGEYETVGWEEAQQSP
ncbi:MAG: hypothetical protein A3F95_03130 [Candidatus Nealsonbacteria bacterium RIFCSPLOWO2_12_FULL_39_31]|uniref:Uncharacterized protein n=3 Tax=Candidatus Nealsoniibacteriota TaxID=1817911 RepID=A0A1G2EFY5_9BACT|nr:MAG: hypothetical protein A2626_00120 [Candidatus Nealsonbacteria bacterium RIFCSPHIGHO2_01_FULL_38_55]OGZ22179.1 MAG: hypothetical protein A3C48_00370 [Candidatus Nealsonbacteria bacterium RIFCSPHIGHO2_02_FULL_38_75]OGZ22194.1 MAG: hypothetical protein A2W55_02875 [Candidatus Nealsonbacteria bacterium RIFCSPHIGHO2_02_38_10]OGZ22689.1 MAG: hypothetical protein A3E18_01215 [Candidatus Nealsonbacteria bacterium RIFCSPHIGHO2_12_FULL_38_18]OGZ23466.1 MAG: hypothetical protein A2981_01270 [Candid